MPGCCRRMGGVKMCTMEAVSTGGWWTSAPRRPKPQRGFLYLLQNRSVALSTTRLKSNNKQFDGLVVHKEECLLLTEGKLLALKSHSFLMKMDQCYSFTDNRTQCTAQPISCAVSLNIATALTSMVRVSPWHLEIMVSGGERGRAKGRGRGKRELAK